MSQIGSQVKLNCCDQSSMRSACAAALSLSVAIGPGSREKLDGAKLLGEVDYVSTVGRHEGKI